MTDVRFDEILDEDGNPIEGLDIDDAPLARVGNDQESAEFHLKGTAHDHDQQAHAGGGASVTPRQRFAKGRPIKTERALRKSVSDTGSEAVDNYVREDFNDDDQVGHHDINGHLRDVDRVEELPEGINEDDIESEITKLTDLIDNADPIADDVLAYRGIAFGAAEPVTVGSLVTDEAFMSVTTSERVAKEFAASGDLLAIMIPQGSRGILGEPAETEIILQRGSSLRIISITAGVKRLGRVGPRRIEAILEQA